MSYEPERTRRKHTARQLAAQFGVSVRTVQRTVAEERATYEGRADDRRARIVALHRKGLKGKEIAATLGVTPALVSMRLKEAREAGEDLSRVKVSESA